MEEGVQVEVLMEVVVGRLELVTQVDQCQGEEEVQKRVEVEAHQEAVPQEVEVLKRVQEEVHLVP